MLLKVSKESEINPVITTSIAVVFNVFSYREGGLRKNQEEGGGGSTKGMGAALKVTAHHNQPWKEERGGWFLTKRFKGPFEQEEDEWLYADLDHQI